MARFPRPHAGIMAVLMPFVILLLLLIALDPAPAVPAPLDGPSATATACRTAPPGITL